MTITFHVLQEEQKTPNHGQSVAYLAADSWDDWFRYQTRYTLVYFDESGERHYIGGTKIGERNLPTSRSRPKLPSSFESLDEPFFSLGQSDTFYESLNNTGASVRQFILESLRDIALNPDILESVLDEHVTHSSLLRSVSLSTVRRQFHRMAKGGVRLTPYYFTYVPQRGNQDIEPPTFEFGVRPESSPPTNIHAIIGSNGVGKTSLLTSMASSLISPQTSGHGGFYDLEAMFYGETFANLVSVTFSAFDFSANLLLKGFQQESNIRFAYVGLKDYKSQSLEVRLKTPAQISREFALSVRNCINLDKREFLLKAIDRLEIDPLFSDFDIGSMIRELCQRAKTSSRLKSRHLRKLWRQFYLLSSGHKIVALTLTRLVETVDEKTLVLIDEPEAHLHPPLLSTFIRALSELLSDRNGVAIIATHSPVVLQEIPRSCVWKMGRSGEILSTMRPELETFGENLGLLTRDVFGLEVSSTGFHAELRRLVDQGKSFEEIVALFHGQLGFEGQAIARVMVANRDSEQS
ncbi:AAA family ATPase [Bremerella sp. JC770]|uniref:AAA family ATPase n=1 Tax=Bremerella sp. JC770 TaxID=3232137 RepID=UPI0034597669